jgi:heterodisulfide reductase subunit C2
MIPSALEFIPGTARNLVEEVMARSGQNLTLCYQCRRCAGACSVGDETGNLTPDRLIRMIITGDRKNALNNELVWKCVSCYTCGTRCPNDIQTGRITETLKKMAKEAHLEPLNSKIAHFHHAFFTSGLRWGRVNEMEFMGFYEVHNIIDGLKNKKFGDIVRELTTQAALGKKMARQKRMHFGFLTSKGRKELQRLNKKTPRKSEL